MHPTEDADLALIRSLVRATPNFPKEGILFQDIFGLFQQPSAVRMLVGHVLHHLRATGARPDVVVGLDARGFLLAPWIAAELDAAFVPVRKSGKLPGPCVEVAYALEYGEDRFQMQAGAIRPGQRVVVLDDLLATGGSALAAQQLVQQQQGVLVEFVFIIELTALQGRARLAAPTYSLVQVAE